MIRRLKSKRFSTIVDLSPHNIPMVNQAIVVAPELLQKRSEVAERIVMAFVDSLAFTLVPQSKAVVTKTIMKRFQISDRIVNEEEGYQDLLVSVDRKPFSSLYALRDIKRLTAVQSSKAANVKVEELIDARLIRELDENGYVLWIRSRRFTG